MKTLLIVEDEKMIRQGIAVMAKRTSVPIEEVIECKNGLEALEILETQHIDAVFTDIRMPKMNGIELAREMKKRGYPAVVTVISGFDDFNYAVEMLKNGVSDYILKPIKREKLEEVLWKMEEKIQKEGQKSKDYMRAVVHQLKSYLLDGTLSEEELTFLQAQLYELFPNGVYSVIIGGNALLNYFEEENVLAFEDGQKQSVILLSEEQADRYIEGRMQSRQRNLTNEAGGWEPGADEKGIGRSQAADGIAGLRNAYLEAIAARKQAFVMSKFVVGFDKIIEEYPEETVLSIEKLAKKIATEECTKGLKELQDLYFHARHGKSSPDSILSIIKAIHGFLFENYKNMLEKSDSEDLYEPLPLSFGTLEEFAVKEKEWLEVVHNTIVMHLHENTNQEKIHRAMQYVKENYKDDINMAMVSNYVSMNYSLFSIIFKEYTGVNFVNYLKQIRIQEAKRLLLETDEKILDISRSVGYENEKHFMKTFKAVCGISPSEYRKCNKQG